MDVASTYKHSIIMGDFNADLRSDSYDSRQILSFVKSFSLFMVPYGPTHHFQNSSTLLDLCIIDNEDKLVSFKQHNICFLSNHDLIEITYKFDLKRHYRRDIRARDFRSFNVESFCDELTSCNGNLLFETQTVNDKVDILNRYLSNCFDIHAPLHNIRPKHLPAPWLSDTIRIMMKERDRRR